MIAALMIIVLIGLAMLGVLLTSSAGFMEDGKQLLGMLLTFLGAVGAVVLTIMLIVNHSTVNSIVAQYESVKTTIDQSRMNGVSDIERASLTQKIIETNQEIASYKYWNSTIFSDFIPNELAELEELK